MADDIQKISHLLVSCNSIHQNDTKNLFTAIVLYLCINTVKIKYFGEILRMLRLDLIQELSDGIDKFKHTIHPIGHQYITAFLKKDKTEQNLIIQALNNCLAPWDNPLIDYATSASDFDIAEFKKNKITLYVGLNPSDIGRLQPIMQFFYSHIAEKLMQTAQELGCGIENGGICLFMDEFYSIGKLEKFISCIPYFRGYKIKLFLISSNIQNIEKTYGESDTQTIMSSCTFKIAFSANDYKTAHIISQISIDQVKKTELMSWQEIISLSSDLQIILRDKEQPIISKKILYYEDVEMKKRIVAPVAIS